jgi:zinc transport system substrate-binding protein
MHAIVSKMTLTVLLAGSLTVWPQIASAETGHGGRTSCWVSILPQKFFVEKIGGDKVDIHVMVGPGESPATYEPTGRQLTRLAEGSVYFSIGVAFEASLVPRIERNFPDLKVIDTSSGVERRVIEGHTHGDSHSGSSRAVDDPHIWMSPRLAVGISMNILRALCEIDPPNEPKYTRNFARLKSELLETDRGVAEILAPHAGAGILVFHPAYGYFTDAYGLVQVPIEIDGGTPGPRHLASVIDNARANGVTTIFVQPQFSASTARTVAQTIGATVDTLDPLAEDYCRNLFEMAERIAAALNTRAAKE